VTRRPKEASREKTRPPPVSTFSPGGKCGWQMRPSQFIKLTPIICILFNLSRFYLKVVRLPVEVQQLALIAPPSGISPRSPPTGISPRVGATLGRAATPSGIAARSPPAGTITHSPPAGISSPRELNLIYGEEGLYIICIQSTLHFSWGLDNAKRARTWPTSGLGTGWLNMYR